MMFLEVAETASNKTKCRQVRVIENEVRGVHLNWISHHSLSHISSHSNTTMRDTESSIHDKIECFYNFGMQLQE